MLPTLEKIVFAVVILVTAWAFLTPLVRRFRIVRAGRPRAPVRRRPEEGRRGPCPRSFSSDARSRTSACSRDSCTSSSSTGRSRSTS